MRCSCTAHSKIRIDHIDVELTPPEFASAVAERILQPQALLIAHDLVRCRLTNVDYGLAILLAASGVTVCAVIIVAVPITPMVANPAKIEYAILRIRLFELCIPTATARGFSSFSGLSRARLGDAPDPLQRTKLASIPILITQMDYSYFRR